MRRCGDWASSGQVFTGSVITKVRRHSFLVGDDRARRIEKRVAQRSARGTVVENRLTRGVLELERRASDQVGRCDCRETHPTSLRMATWGCFTISDGCSPAAGQDAQGSGAKQGVTCDCAVDPGNFGSDGVQGNVHIRILGDDGSTVIMTDYEHDGVRHVEWLFCCDDVVKCREGVMLDVHFQHRDHTTCGDIRTKTGCRNSERTRVVLIWGRGNLFSQIPQQTWETLLGSIQASDRNQRAEQIEQTT
jgi:hypothetical protein